MFADELMNFRGHGANNLLYGLRLLIVDLEIVHLEHLEDHSYFIHTAPEVSI